MDDKRIIEGCIKGNPRYQKILYDKYASKLFAVSMRYCKSKEEAEDSLQDAFINIYTRISTYRDFGSFEGWLKRVVINCALRSKDKKFRKFEPGDIEKTPEKIYNANIVESMSAYDILKLIQLLPERSRAVFNLYVIDGYQHKEIANMLKITEVTSRSQLNRAKNKLSKLIEQNI